MVFVLLVRMDNPITEFLLNSIILQSPPISEGTGGDGTLQLKVIFSHIYSAICELLYNFSV